MADDATSAIAKTARAIGDEVADRVMLRDSQRLRELRLLTEIGMDQRTKQLIEQSLKEFRAHQLNPELEQVLIKVSGVIKEYVDKRFQAVSEQLKIVGHYVGQWKPGQLYHRHQVVTHAGSLYFCQAESTWATPTEGEIEWQLRVRGVPAEDEIPMRPAHSNGSGLSHDTN
jgi:hypothetical protein